MGTRKYKPTTPALRNRIVLDFEEVTVKKAQKTLKVSLNRKSGRNNTGRITVRRRGGGVKRMYRLIDFKRDKIGVEGTIKTIEYDPNRSCNIALVYYKDGHKAYIIHPNGLKIGDKIMAGSDVDIRAGNTLPLKNIPVGSIIHNIELSIGKGGQLARSAGTNAVLMAKADKYATIKMPSGEIRLINLKCCATLGQVGNSEKRNTSVSKAGVNRKRGKRPQVRGSVMNPCDHPHGGGEGRAPIGKSGPCTPWGKPTLGYKTRKKKKQSDKLILRKRRK
jgi:large subunit ribosomal protein L2